MIEYKITIKHLELSIYGIDQAGLIADIFFSRSYFYQNEYEWSYIDIYNKHLFNGYNIINYLIKIGLLVESKYSFKLILGPKALLKML